MTPAIREELERRLQVDRGLRNSYTRRAYGLLPALQAPDILDLGCGRGGPTMVLARLGAVRVTGRAIDGLLVLYTFWLSL
jgi:2-polyprenyl-3-methyl-5-hydroxy-6-metoxy-1,4-benzoquinol methylase